MIIFSILLSGFVAYLTIQIALVWRRNQRAHKFFLIKTPKLPVLPTPKAFSGHMLDVLLVPKNWQIFKTLHEKLGPSIGFYNCEQPWVATKDLDLIKLVFVDEGHKHINRAIWGVPFGEIAHSIFQAKDDNWRRIRRIVGPALSNHKVRNDEISDDIKSVVDRLSASLEFKFKKRQQQQQVDGSFKGTRTTGKQSILINAFDTWQRYALSIVFLTTYKQADAIDFNAERDSWVSLMEANERRLVNPIVCASIMFPFLRPICTFVLNNFHSVGFAKAKMIKYITKATEINRVARERHEKIQKKKKSNETNGGEQVMEKSNLSFSSIKQDGDFKRRLVDTFIDAFLEKKISYDNFTGTLLFLLLAGFETSADTTSALVWLLADHPEIQEKLRQTILQPEGIDSDYVNWCIMESIRWHTPVNLGIGRTLANDVIVNEILYPKGTFIMPSIYSIHHDPRIWPEPEKYDPERWKESSKFHSAAFMGFGLGPRNCVGGKLALYQIKLALQMLLSKYRIETCDETCKTYDFTSAGLLYSLPDRPIILKLVEI